jgi:hypothetical protein
MLGVDKALAQPAPEVTVVSSGLPPGTTRVMGALWAYRPEGGANATSGAVHENESVFPALSIRRVYAPAGARIQHRAGFDIGDPTHMHMMTAWHDQVQSEIHVGAVPLADVASVAPGDSDVAASWSLADGPRGDALRVDMTFGPVDLSDPQEHSRRWLITLATDATSVVLPTLPPELSSWAPASGPHQLAVDHIDVLQGDGVAAACNAQADQSAEQWINRFVSL